MLHLETMMKDEFLQLNPMPRGFDTDEFHTWEREQEKYGKREAARFNWKWGTRDINIGADGVVQAVVTITLAQPRSVP